MSVSKFNIYNPIAALEAQSMLVVNDGTTTTTTPPTTTTSEGTPTTTTPPTTTFSTTMSPLFSTPLNKSIIDGLSSTRHSKGFIQLGGDLANDESTSESPKLTDFCVTNRKLACFSQSSQLKGSSSSSLNATDITIGSGLMMDGTMLILDPQYKFPFSLKQPNQPREKDDVVNKEYVDTKLSTPTVVQQPHPGKIIFNAGFDHMRNFVSECPRYVSDLNVPNGTPLGLEGSSFIVKIPKTGPTSLQISFKNGSTPGWSGVGTAVWQDKPFPNPPIVKYCRGVPVDNIIINQFYYLSNTVHGGNNSFDYGHQAIYGATETWTLYINNNPIESAMYEITCMYFSATSAVSAITIKKKS